MIAPQHHGRPRPHDRARFAVRLAAKAVVPRRFLLAPRIMRAGSYIIYKRSSSTPAAFCTAPVSPSVRDFERAWSSADRVRGGGIDGRRRRQGRCGCGCERSSAGGSGVLAVLRPRAGPRGEEEPRHRPGRRRWRRRRRAGPRAWTGPRRRRRYRRSVGVWVWLWVWVGACGGIYLRV
ncbi:uncharacterized protein LOC100382354 [Zea mays]|uniref:Uncharacterized protein n=1 Tax=Zea mays TaxID=4577 RepID=C0P6U1_MAIZE|nr:uncharacterized protein LOC100382354 [Zea mays]ACN28707.1 unknown [Zea mays]|eukprot:NP_001168571.1 uncharacterized protein LOC100382354 [Zea mays]